MINKFLLLLLISTCAYTQTIKNTDPYYLHKKSQFEMLSQNNKYKTVMLGDSITDGGLWNELLDNNTIQNRGIAGDTSDGVLDRLNSINPSIKEVFIMIGINDFFQEKSVDYVFSNYQKIVEILTKKNIKVYIQSTLFTGDENPNKYNQKVELLNEKLNKFAFENKIEFINLNKILAPNNVLKSEYSYDKLHLNGFAYSLWVNELKKYLKK